MTRAAARSPSASRTRSQVIWAQFRKHQLAVWGARILLVLYTMALFAGFFSTYDANYYETYPPSNNHPPSKIHFRDPDTGAWSRPFVYATKRTLDELTLQPKYLEDKSQGKFYIRFLTRTPDQPYTILRLFKSDLRLLGVDKPGRLFLVGTDNFGRDLWSRVVYGSQVSLTIGILASIVSFILGLALGGVAGFYSGRPATMSVPLGNLWGRGAGAQVWLGAVFSTLLWLAVIVGIVLIAVQFLRVTHGFSLLGGIVVALAGWAIWGITRGLLWSPIRIDPDDVIMRSVEIQSAIPDLFLLITLRAIFPPSIDALFSFYLITVLLGFIGWGGLARIVRGTVLSTREQDYVTAAQAVGANDRRIIAQHILPATATYVIISLSLAVPGAILGESGLSFLGLGIREPYVSWGLLLQSAQEGGFASFTDRPWVLIPGFFIVLAIVAWNFLGDGLRDAFDPRKRQ